MSIAHRSLSALLVAASAACGCAGVAALYGCRQTEAVLQEPAAGPSATAIPGLEVTGPRTRANVIAHLEPLIAKMQEIYAEHRARNPDLEGRVDLEITVEWTGELVRRKILRSTTNDPVFDKALARPLSFLEFDLWSRTDEDTQIVCPVVFVK